jgi:3-dehydroquinate synthase
MVIESTIAERLGIAQAGTTARIVTAIVRAGLPTTIPDGLSGNEILRASRADKKARGGSVEYALPTRVGAMAGDATGWAIAVPDEVVLDALGPTIRPTTAGTETNRSS